MRLPRLQRARRRSGALAHTIDEYERRLSYEIDMIKKMKYPGYFLIVWDFIRYAREQGIPVGPGRGSAAGSFVAYCLRITDVDPIEYDLIFERFLNPERVSLPDIDIDFCERRRGEVIEYVTQKYGRENVAQIITFGTMKARAVVRDVARVMDIPYADADRVAKAVPPALDMTLEKALAESPALKEMEQKDERVKELLAVARRLEGMTRHASVHAAGVVIAPRPLTEFVPLYKSQKDEIVTQWAMKEVERVGLLKMDFLGLSTLTLIRDALDEIKRTEGIDARHRRDPARRRRRPTSCSRTARPTACSSSRARACASCCARPSRERLDDLIALNALYRPGPLKSGMVDDFIARKQGKTEVKYELPAARADPVRHLRRHRLPGTGHAHRRGPGRVLDGAVRRAAQGHGQEGSQGHGQAARGLHAGRAGQRGQREEGEEDLRPDGVLRRLRLQQVALDDLRAARVPDGVPEGELSRGTSWPRC